MKISINNLGVFIMNSANKTIFSISMVKNEEDIIESFVRYHMCILDGMIILDNGSEDNTLEILNALKEEGIPIYIFESENKIYNQYQIRNELLLKAINKFKVDIVTPLDADEFLISTSGGNPRKILEKIDSDTFLLLKWKTYVPDPDKNQDETFIPAKITSARDESLENYYKVIVPREIVEKYHAKLSKGCHGLLYDRKYNKNIYQHITPDLRIAHFPIRSKDQTVKKVVVGWINTLNHIEKGKTESYHWKLIFDVIKEGNITDGDFVNFAKYYALKNNPSNVFTNEDPMDLSFCEDIEIIYKQSRVKPISIVLETLEYIIIQNTANRKESIQQIDLLNNTIKSLRTELAETLAQEKILNSKILKYEKSKSWKITSPIRKIGKIMRNLSS
jgi:glycosyltransferase involved in cell wall biosynthesis